MEYSLIFVSFSNQLKISNDFSYLKIATAVTLLAKPLLDIHDLELLSPSNLTQTKKLYLQMVTARLILCLLLPHRLHQGLSSSIDNKLSIARLEVLWI
jgi:hypothetical protein